MDKKLEPVTLEAIERDPWNAVRLPIPKDASKELLTQILATAQSLAYEKHPEKFSYVYDEIDDHPTWDGITPLPIGGTAETSEIPSFADAEADQRIALRRADAARGRLDTLKANEFAVSQTWWRADSGFRNSRDTTAADVLHHEQHEAGNDYGWSADDISILAKVPASGVVWVTKTPEDAARYGDPEPITLGATPHVLATDGDGGFLVLRSGYVTDEIRKAFVSNPRMDVMSVEAIERDPWLAVSLPIPENARPELLKAALLAAANEHVNAAAEARELLYGLGNPGDLKDAQTIEKECRERVALLAGLVNEKQPEPLLSEPSANDLLPPDIVHVVEDEERRAKHRHVTRSY